MKPFAPSCERNQAVILDKLKPLISRHVINSVLEVASGTGQHAVYFCRHLVDLTWQLSDLNGNLAGISLWQQESQNLKLLPPIALDVSATWPMKTYDAVFTANSLHIMSEASVKAFFAGLSSVTQQHALCIIYGPFNRNGSFTSQSNHDFDQWLKNRNPDSGIRDFEWVNTLAEDQGFHLLHDLPMPANNQLIVWQKKPIKT